MSSSSRKLAEMIKSGWIDIALMYRWQQGPPSRSKGVLQTCNILSNNQSKAGQGSIASVVYSNNVDRASLQFQILQVQRANSSSTSRTATPDKHTMDLIHRHAESSLACIGGVPHSCEQGVIFGVECDCEG